MSEQALSGVGVLVTRPAHQSADLKNAIEAAGGRPILFPVIEIEPRPAADINVDVTAIREPDIVVFVSANAVRHGLPSTHCDDVRVAAIGPATAAALKDAGVHIDTPPAGGFDSESLLSTELLTNVAGKSVLIVRGTSGRELLAETLRDRGAMVEYLPVYTRRTVVPANVELEGLEGAWRDEKIDAVMVMSVASLHGLLEILPTYCLEQMPKTRLVAPSTRVIQTAIEHIPGLTGILSPQPGAIAMTDALIANLQAEAEIENG